MQLSRIKWTDVVRTRKLRSQSLQHLFTASSTLHLDGFADLASLPDRGE